MLKGLWLKEAGFDIGDYISVICEDGKLISTPDTERARLHRKHELVMAIAYTILVSAFSGWHIHNLIASSIIL